MAEQPAQNHQDSEAENDVERPTHEVPEADLDEVAGGRAIQQIHNPKTRLD